MDIDYASLTVKRSRNRNRYSEVSYVDIASDKSGNLMLMMTLYRNSSYDFFIRNGSQREKKI